MSWPSSGGTGPQSIAGEGFNVGMLAALAGWSAGEDFVMRAVRKLDQV